MFWLCVAYSAALHAVLAYAFWANSRSILNTEEALKLLREFEAEDAAAKTRKRQSGASTEPGMRYTAMPARPDGRVRLAMGAEGFELASSDLTTADARTIAEDLLRFTERAEAMKAGKEAG